MPDELLSWARFGVATAAAVLLLVDRQVHRAVGRRWKIVVGVCFACLALGSLVGDRAQSRTPFQHHSWEFFHYYLGSKYAPEVGYKRLYTCVAVAEDELGGNAELRRSRIRDLRDHSTIPVSRVLQEPEQCKQHFSTPAWHSFKQDVEWFRKHSGGATRWRAMQLDHGYNPSPVWTVVGRALSSLGPPSTGYFNALAWIDIPDGSSRPGPP